MKADGHQNVRGEKVMVPHWVRGEETAEMVASSAATDPDQVQGYLAAFEQAGCDELIMFPSSSDPAQADLLAEATEPQG